MGGAIMRTIDGAKRGMKYFLFSCLTLFVVFQAVVVRADTKAETDRITAILDKECVNLKKDKLRSLLLAKFSGDIEKGLSPDLLKIMEGVVKRTDFDNISEDKTAELISLVYESFKKGAPLDYLDQLFDVGYAKTISVDNLTAAAKALKEFHHSDVPQDVAEEFVYRSLEDNWDPAAMPVLTRGLIYGTERGLTPQKVALIIMLDVRNGELQKKGPDKLVLDGIRLVREKEPQKWQPLKKAEREMIANQERMRKLEELRQQAEAEKRQREIDKKRAEEELQRMRARELDKARVARQEQEAQRIERMLQSYQAQILQYQLEQKNLDAGMSAYRAQMEREKQQRDREREQARKRQLDDMGQNVSTIGKSGQLNVTQLYAAVDHYLGVPYRYGGDSEAGIDCSAFTRRVYRTQHVELPRSSLEQSFVGFGVGEAIMRPGDLVFFDASITGRISHVGVYLGGGVFVHASSSRGVTKSSIRERYYMQRFVKAKRIFNQ
jgi:cell wall-associated NlpC family hydrolase